MLERNYLDAQYIKEGQEDLETYIAVDAAVQKLLDKRRVGDTEPISSIMTIALLGHGSGRRIREVVTEFDDPLSVARIGMAGLYREAGRRL